MTWASIPFVPPVRSPSMSALVIPLLLKISSPAFPPETSPSTVASASAPDNALVSIPFPFASISPSTLILERDPSSSLTAFIPQALDRTPSASAELKPPTLLYAFTPENPEPSGMPSVWTFPVVTTAYEPSFAVTSTPLPSCPE